MKIPFLALLFQGIPEQIAVVALAFVIAKIPLEWKKIVPIGAALAVSSYFLRLLPITFGVHTIIIMGLLFLLLFKFGRSNINASLIASMLSFLTLILVETLCVSILMPVFEITSEVLFTDTTVRILISWPQVLIMYFIAYIILKVRTRKDKHIGI